MLKPITFTAAISLLCACGGGGGGGNTPAPSNPPAQTSSSSSISSSLSSVSSSSSSSVILSSSSSSQISSSSSSISSSSSSASSVNPCNNTSGTIFAECLNSNYGYVIGAQYSPSYIEYITSRAGEQVQWSVVDSDSTHNKVLDVSFTDSNRKGQLIIGRPDSNPGTIDISQFQTGNLRFDIRVTDFGDAYDAQAGGVVFVTRMDCTWPCSSHETKFVIPTVDTWVNVSIPIQDLIATGLDITKVSASLVLIPSGKQANLGIQLDNVQLTKGGPVTASPAIIFKEDFNNKTIPEWKITNIAGNSTTTATTNYGFGAALNITWQGVNDKVRFDTTLNKSIDITNKQASFQIICWKNTTMNFSFQMVSTDVNGITETTDANYASSLQADTSYKVYADFGSIFTGSYDPKRISKIGLQFNYLGSTPNTSICQVDTIRITEK